MADGCIGGGAKFKVRIGEGEGEEVENAGGCEAKGTVVPPRRLGRVLSVIRIGNELSERVAYIH